MNHTITVVHVAVWQQFFALITVSPLILNLFITNNMYFS